MNLKQCGCTCSCNVSLYTFIHAPTSNICTSRKATGRGTGIHSSMSLMRSAWAQKKRRGSIAEKPTIWIGLLLLVSSRENDSLYAEWFLYSHSMWRSQHCTFSVICNPQFNKLSQDSKKCVYVLMCMPNWKKIAVKLKNSRLNLFSYHVKCNCNSELIINSMN